MTTRRPYALALALIVGLGAATVPLLAHMQATKMAPAADATIAASPAQVEVWFSQEPDPKLSKLEVSGASGAVKLKPIQITKNMSIVAAIDGTLADGRYMVRWQSAGDDGHVQKGEYAFSVKNTR